jgi:hypothetical protein
MLSIDTNTPLIKMIGNLISVESIMIFDGTSVGGADMTRARDEKQNDAMTVPIIT